MAAFSDFHDVLFPLGVSFGTMGGPERRNEIVALTSGREKRNARFADSRRHYDAGTGVRSLDDLHAVLNFFEARRGSLHAFRFRDPFDMKSCPPGESSTATDQALGIGDGVAKRFALVKSYGEGADAYRRSIARPVASSLNVAVGGLQLAAGLSSFDAATGEVVLTTAPPAGAAVTAGYEFDVPVRFDIERLTFSITAFRAGEVPSIPLVEVLS